MLRGVKVGFVLLVLASLLGVVAVGCGGDDSTASTSVNGSAASDTSNGDGGSDNAGPPLTKAAFIKKAESLCQKADGVQRAGLEKVANEGNLNNPSRAEQEELILELALPPLRDAFEGISELGPPEGDEAEIEAIIDAVETAIEESEDEPLLVTLEKGNPFKRGSQLAADYGFKSCSEIP